MKARVERARELQSAKNNGRPNGSQTIRPFRAQVTQHSAYCIINLSYCAHTHGALGRDWAGSVLWQCVTVDTNIRKPNSSGRLGRTAHTLTATRAHMQAHVIAFIRSNARGRGESSVRASARVCVSRSVIRSMARTCKWCPTLVRSRSRGTPADYVHGCVLCARYIVRL